MHGPAERLADQDGLRDDERPGQDPQHGGQREVPPCRARVAEQAGVERLHRGEVLPDAAGPAGASSKAAARSVRPIGSGIASAVSRLRNTQYVQPW